MLLAIDPGTEQSAYVVYDASSRRPIADKGIRANDEMLDIVTAWDGLDEMAIEMVASYGMPVGREVFETVLWIGRFIERWPNRHQKVYRKDVKHHLCGSSRAKDANIRQALIDMWGPGKEKAIGRKKTPVPLYGVRSHEWAALAVAVTATET